MGSGLGLTNKQLEAQGYGQFQIMMLRAFENRRPTYSDRLKLQVLKAGSPRELRDAAQLVIDLCNREAPIELILQALIRLNNTISNGSAKITRFSFNVPFSVSVEKKKEEL